MDEQQRKEEHLTEPTPPASPTRDVNPPHPAPPMPDIVKHMTGVERFPGRPGPERPSEERSA